MMNVKHVLIIESLMRKSFDNRCYDEVNENLEVERLVEILTTMSDSD